MPRPGKPPINISHRGHAESLENTLKSFHESIDIGGQMLELDVRLSKDGVPIVFHDNTLNRIARRKGSISSRTANFLVALDLGEGLRICTLDKALEELLPRVPVNIEMKFKDLNYRPLVSAVGETIEKHGAQSRVLVSSFFHQSLEILNRTWETVATAPLFGKSTGAPHPDDLKRLSKSRKNWRNDLPFAAPAAVVDWCMIDAGLVKDFARRELTLLTYTVDNPEEMRRLIELGVDGIITNRPGVLRGVIEEIFSR